MSTVAVARPQIVSETELPETETHLYTFSVQTGNVAADADTIRDLLTFSSDKGRYTLKTEEGDGVVHVNVRWTEEGEVSVSELPTATPEEEPAEKRKRAEDEAKEQPEQAGEAEEAPSPKKARASADEDGEGAVPEKDAPIE
jgi:hypothetical protein